MLVSLFEMEVQFCTSGELDLFYILDTVVRYVVSAYLVFNMALW